MASSDADTDVDELVVLKHIILNAIIHGISLIFFEIEGTEDLPPEIQQTKAKLKPVDQALNIVKCVTPNYRNEAELKNLSCHAMGARERFDECISTEFCERSISGC